MSQLCTIECKNELSTWTHIHNVILKAKNGRDLCVMHQHLKQQAAEPLILRTATVVC